jgi:hypothetical protein
MRFVIWRRSFLTTGLDATKLRHGADVIRKLQKKDRILGAGRMFLVKHGLSFFDALR